MLESGFITAALAFVGILPAREVHRDIPEFDLAPLPVDPVVRPTTTRSPRPDVAAVPVEPVTGTDRIFFEHDRKLPVVTGSPLPPARTQMFVDWLVEIEEFGELTQRRLLALYAEFCLDRYDPVTTRRLLLQIGPCGVEKRRASPKSVNGKTHRGRVYWVSRPLQRERRAAAA